MRTPRGLRSNKPSVHIDKDRGNEQIILARRSQFRSEARECNALIERINGSCGGVEGHPLQATGEAESADVRQPAGIKPCPQEAYSLGYHIGGALMIGCIIVCSVFVFIVKAKAQELRPGDLAPGPVYCQGAEQKIQIAKANKLFTAAFALSGSMARDISHHVFGHVPPADHIVLMKQPDGGSIMVPCVWTEKGPAWAGDMAHRVSIDMAFKRDLENPKTASDEPKRTRRGK